MHDWTLVDVLVDWASAIAVMRVIDRTSTPAEVRIRGLRGVALRRDEPWGPSGFITGYSGPEHLRNGTSRLLVTIQSGDVLVFEAEEFEFPCDA